MKRFIKLLFWSLNILALIQVTYIALGPLVYHNKEWVCLIKPLRNVLVMHRLRFSNEIRSEEGLVIPETAIKPEELKMASALIAQLTKPFKPEEYKDEYSEN